MADPYGSAAPSTPLDSDEISTFFNQFLQNASSSAPSSSCSRLRAQYHNMFAQLPHDTKSAAVSEVDPDRFGGSVGRSDEMILVTEGNSVNSVSVADLSASSGFDISDPGVCIRPDVKDGPENTLSSGDYLSCDREKQSDASGVPSDTVRSRNSSKRSRAAEVHNMSEKRRRSRINERMKALQKLIPNSNKTDKASMLDEAIEYLKELQLQVQMLTMRNGMNLYPFCFPGLLNPIQTGFNGGSGLLNTNRTADSFPANLESSVQPALNFSNQYIDSNQQTSIPMVSNLAIASVTPFGFEPSPHASYGSFNITAPSDGICKDDRAQTQIDPNQSRNDSSGVS